MRSSIASSARMAASSRLRAEADQPSGGCHASDELSTALGVDSSLFAGAPRLDAEVLIATVEPGLPEGGFPEPNGLPIPAEGDAAEAGHAEAGRFRLTGAVGSADIGSITTGGGGGGGNADALRLLGSLLPLLGRGGAATPFSLPPTPPPPAQLLPELPPAPTARTVPPAPTGALVGTGDGARFAFEGRQEGEEGALGLASSGKLRCRRIRSLPETAPSRPAQSVLERTRLYLLGVAERAARARGVAPPPPPPPPPLQVASVSSEAAEPRRRASAAAWTTPQAAAVEQAGARSGSEIKPGSLNKWSLNLMHKAVKYRSVTSSSASPNCLSARYRLRRCRW